MPVKDMLDTYPRSFNVDAELLAQTIDLRVDGGAGPAVFAGEPVVGQVQVDPCRLDRAVTGLGLHRLQRHAGLLQTRQTGVTQLMAGSHAQGRRGGGRRGGSHPPRPPTAAGPGWGP
jgi:hypothetical protein